ncbi:helix-turn-helix transcriptional regulator [Chloroflexota bacterium]
MRRRGYYRKSRTGDMQAYLTYLRMREKLTQQEVADRMGRSRSYICQIENGRRTPSPRLLRELAIIYEELPERVLMKAGLFEMFTLTAIAAPEELPENPLSDVEGVSEDERRELLRYLGFLRLKGPEAS